MTHPGGDMTDSPLRTSPLTAVLKLMPRYGLTLPTSMIYLGLNGIAAFMEAFGIGIFLPIFQFIRLKGDLDALTQDSRLWQGIVDAMAFVGLTPTLASMLGLAFTAFMLRQVTVYIRIIFEARVRGNMIKAIRLRGFDYYFHARMNYYDSVQVGDLVNTLSNEANDCIGALLSPLMLISFIAISLGYIVLLLALSLPMTVAAAVLLTFAALMMRRWFRASAHTGYNLTTANNQLAAFLLDRMKSPRLVRLSNTLAAETDQMESLVNNQRRHYIRTAALAGRTQVALEPIVIGLSCIFLFVAVTHFDMQIERIGLFLVISLRLIPLVKSILDQWQTMLKMAAGPLNAVETRLTQMETECEVDTGTRILERIDGAISLENVVFKYPNADGPALNGVTVKIPSGRLTALVGPSGSGKSTLIDLLLRLRDLDSGKILFGDLEIRDITLRSLRQSIAYAPQNPQVFDGTISDHILYGKPDASRDEIVAAAITAGAHEFIGRLSDGYDTRLGENGVRLSGGQRQRLDLARAIIRGAPVLILDEPTSHLDAESEEAFRQAIHRIHLNSQVTIIIVAHRLSTIREADQIIVLKDGVVDAVGNHESVADACAWYRRALSLQSVGEHQIIDGELPASA